MNFEWISIVLVSSSEAGHKNLWTADTRIFSPRAVPRLCDTIGRYWYLFKRLTAVIGGPFYRFEHIETNSSGKVVAKLKRHHEDGTGRR